MSVNNFKSHIIPSFEILNHMKKFGSKIWPKTDKTNHTSLVRNYIPVSDIYRLMPPYIPSP